MRRKTVAVILALGFVAAAFFVADAIATDWRNNEETAGSAPQQTVSAEWAVKDASINGLRLLGVLGGVVILSLLVLMPTIPDVWGDPGEDKLVKAGLRQRCQWCAEAVRPQAVVCRYCGRDLYEQSDESPTAGT
jgi:hypothetical protein